MLIEMLWLFDLFFVHCTCELNIHYSSSFSATDWPLSILDNMEALSVKVPVSSSMSPVSEPGGGALETSLPSSSAGDAAGFGADITDLSFYPLLGHDSLMSERDSQADPDASDTPDTPHSSFELCPPRGPSDCTSSSFDIVFEDSGCDRDAEAETDSTSGPACPGSLKNSSSSSHTKRQESFPHSSSTPPRPTSLTLALPTTPSAQRVQPSPKVSKFHSKVKLRAGYTV